MQESATRLAAVVATLRRQWGDAAIRWGGEHTGAIARIPFGSAPIDALTGGLPRGRVTELRGTPTSGMTTIALRLAAHTQAQGELVAWLDLAAAFDTEYAARCGIDLSALLLAQPRAAIEALDLLRALVATSCIGLLVIDQLGMLQANPRHSHLLDQALHGLAGPLAQSPTALVVLSTTPYAPDLAHAMAGHGSLIAHVAALRLAVVRTGWHADALRLTCDTRIIVLKDKISGVHGEAVLTLDFEPHAVFR